MLTDLALFRHGKAVRPGEAASDRDRGLVERGLLQARDTSGRLAAAGFAPDIVLVSPARRTRETWEAARSAFPAAPVAVVDEMYLADARDLLSLAAGEGAARVLMIGHNPGLHDLGIELARTAARAGDLAALNEHLPTSAIAWLTRPRPDGAFALKTLLAPARM